MPGMNMGPADPCIGPIGPADPCIGTIGPADPYAS